MCTYTFCALSGKKRKLTKIQISFGNGITIGWAAVVGGDTRESCDCVCVGVFPAFICIKCNKIYCLFVRWKMVDGWMVGWAV